MNLDDIGNFGMVPFLCSTFLCINTYAQQSNLPVHYSRGESAIDYAFGLQGAKGVFVNLGEVF